MDEEDWYNILVMEAEEMEALEAEPEKFQYRIRMGAMYFVPGAPDSWSYQEEKAERFDREADANWMAIELQGRFPDAKIVVDPCN
jgi:hypothetical protein